jgi:Sec-independent protein translocase protein TatA
VPTASDLRRLANGLLSRAEAETASTADPAIDESATQEAAAMADFHKIAKQVSEMAERVADVSDAASGNRSRRRSGGLGRWLLLPAAGAAVYAVAKRAPTVGRSAGDATRAAKDRVGEMPDVDLLDRVHEVAGLRTDGKGEQARQARGLEDYRHERAERRERRQSMPAG